MSKFALEHGRVTKHGIADLETIMRLQKELKSK